MASGRLTCLCLPLFRRWLVDEPYGRQLPPIWSFLGRACRRLGTERFLLLVPFCGMVYRETLLLPPVYLFFVIVLRPFCLPGRFLALLLNFYFIPIVS